MAVLFLLSNLYNSYFTLFSHHAETVIIGGEKRKKEKSKNRHPYLLNFKINVYFPVNMRGFLMGF